MGWLIGQYSALGGVAGKALLMYVTALAVLRVAQRRTVAQWTLIDFVTAVAIGAVVGRTAIAGSQSYLTGAVTLVVLLVAHRIASRLRFVPFVRRATEHPVRLLVRDGQLLADQLRETALTEEDLCAHLRQRSFWSLAEIAYVLYEPEGGLTIVPQSAVVGGVPDLVQRALASCATG